MNPTRCPGALALLLAILAVLVLPGGAARAAEPPFGEPYMVKDITPGFGGSELRDRFPLGDVTLFTVETTWNGGQLWRTDGTPGGTFSIHPDEQVLFRRTYTTGGPVHFIQAHHAETRENSLWRTDGTAAGTVRLATGIAIYPPQYHEGLGLYFFSAAPLGSDDDWLKADFEPWVSDGTQGGTRLLKDLVAGESSRPSNLRVFGDRILFAATDPDRTARALWETDGTAAGTRVVKIPGGSVYTIQPSEHLAYLEVQDGGYGLHLWVTDGTTEGTVPLATFGVPGQLEQHLGLVFVAHLGDGRILWVVETEDVPASLWASDGTAAGTRRLMRLHIEPRFHYPMYFVPYRGALYFAADDGTTGLELWRTDGTPEGTEVAFETCPGACTDFKGVYRTRDGVLVISRFTAEHGSSTWTTDGTAEGTELFLDLCPGPCPIAAHARVDFGGWSLFSAQVVEGGRFQLWATDDTPEGTRPLTDLAGGVSYGNTLSPFGRLGTRHLFLGDDGEHGTELWAIQVLPFDPPTPLGPWIESPALPGYDFKVRISGGETPLVGVQEASCLPETVCVSGAVPGRAEVFLRVVGPKPNGRMWPTLVKFSTSTVDVWVRQRETGQVRYYRLDGARKGVDELPGLFDREGFEPVGAAASGLGSALGTAEAVVLAAGEVPAPPAAVFTSPDVPGYRFRARITAGDQVQETRKETACIEETLCLSGALPGRAEVFLRIVGPKPNGRMWPTIVKFSTSTLEVWIEQVATGETRYYRIDGAAPGRDDLTGLFDRSGFPAESP